MRKQLLAHLRAKMLDRHEDGTKHHWYSAPVGPHFCEWDYCHCWRKQCSCGESRIVSDGTDEIR